jgi:phenylalanyl-tRNA synthetase alpha chain
MLEQIETLRQQAEQDLAAASDAAALESFRVVYLARKGKIADLFDALRNAPADQRPVLGKHLNALRTTVQQAFDLKVAGAAQDRPRASQIDLSLPGRSVHA